MKKLIILFCINLAFAWQGYEKETNSYIEISKSAKEKTINIVYDYATHTKKELFISEIKNNTIRLLDNGKERVFEMQQDGKFKSGVLPYQIDITKYEAILNYNRAERTLKNLLANETPLIEAMIKYKDLCEKENDDIYDITYDIHSCLIAYELYKAKMMSEDYDKKFVDFTGAIYSQLVGHNILNCIHDPVYCSLPAYIMRNHNISPNGKIDFNSYIEKGVKNMLETGLKIGCDSGEPNSCDIYIPFIYGLID